MFESISEHLIDPQETPLRLFQRKSLVSPFLVDTLVSQSVKMWRSLKLQPAVIFFACTKPQQARIVCAPRMGIFEKSFWVLERWSLILSVVKQLLRSSFLVDSWNISLYYHVLSISLVYFHIVYIYRYMYIYIWRFPKSWGQPSYHPLLSDFP